jgi:hypothetical protein
MFAIHIAGDMSGRLAQWFAAGSLYGTFKLTPASSSAPPTASSFARASYSGTVTLRGASGALKGTTGRGRMVCTTPDSLHYTSKERLTLSEPVSG